MNEKGYYQNEKNKKVTGLIKDELGWKIITEIVGLRAKIYIYLIDDGSEDKIAKGKKTYVMKRKRKFEKHKNCLGATQLENNIKCNKIIKPYKND